MSEFERLTTKNCDGAILYDSGLSPSELADLAKAKAEGRILPEGFSIVELSDGKALSIFHPEGLVVFHPDGKVVACEKMEPFEALKQNGGKEDA